MVFLDGKMKPEGSGGGGGNAGPFQENEAGTVIIPIDNGDSLIVGSDRMDHDPSDLTKNIRMFFNKVKGAFRGGRALSTQWDDASVGDNSFAYGENARATGANSVAIGREAAATESSATAIGTYVTASKSSSFASGSSTVAEGIRSAAFNSSTRASGFDSFACGASTVASGSAAHAEGDNSQATNTAAHSEGRQTRATGSYAHAEGNMSQATDTSTHAEGNNTRATGYAAHAEGNESHATGQMSHAEGDWAQATRRGQSALGGGAWDGMTPGQAQAARIVLRRQTTDATATVLTAGGGVPALTGQETNVLTVTASRALQLRISAVARRTDVQGEMAGWTWEGLVGRDSTGNARIIGAPTQTKWGDAPATDAWTLAVSIDTTNATNNYVAVTATGEAGKTVRWVAKLEWVEVGG